MQDRIKNQLKVNEVDYEKQTLDMLIKLAEDPPTHKMGQNTETEETDEARKEKPWV